MTVEVLSDARGLEDEWWDLWHRDRAATAFQSPAWLLPWRRQFDEGESLVVAIRRGGRLTGLVPLFRHDGRLLLWGSGTSDLADGVFDPELEPQELSRAVAQLRAPVDLFQLRSGSPLLDAALPPGWSERRGASESCLALSLPAKLPGRMTQNLGYYRRRAARSGVAAPERADPSCLEDLVELHRRRWNKRGEAGVLADPRVLAWHREALPALAAADLARLYVVRMDDRPVAALYLLRSDAAAFYYIGGFDPELAALGLGTVLIGHAIAEAEREGARSFDFLRGQEPYKYRWGATDRPTHARFLSPEGRA